MADFVWWGNRYLSGLDQTFNEPGEIKMAQQPRIRSRDTNRSEKFHCQRTEAAARSSRAGWGMRACKSSLIIALFSITFSSCASSPLVNGGIYLDPGPIAYVEVSPVETEIVGAFEIVNASASAVCFNEDVLINRMSPYVDVSTAAEMGTSGIPFPPLSTKITSINPGDRREARRVIGYANSAPREENRYTISVRLWDCETSKLMVRRAAFSR